MKGHGADGGALAAEPPRVSHGRLPPLAAFRMKSLHSGTALQKSCTGARPWDPRAATTREPAPRPMPDHHVPSLPQGAAGPNSPGLSAARASMPPGHITPMPTLASHKAPSCCGEAALCLLLEAKIRGTSPFEWILSGEIFEELKSKQEGRGPGFPLHLAVHCAGQSATPQPAAHQDHPF